jgi:hypothetical protein
LDGDVAGKAERHIVQNGPAQPMHLRFGDGGTAGFLPAEMEFAVSVELTADGDEAARARQGSIFDRVGRELVKDEREILCRAGAEQNVAAANVALITKSLQLPLHDPTQRDRRRRAERIVRSGQRAQRL